MFSAIKVLFIILLVVVILIYWSLIKKNKLKKTPNNVTPKKDQPDYYPNKVKKFLLENGFFETAENYTFVKHKDEFEFTVYYNPYEGGFCIYCKNIVTCKQSRTWLVGSFHETNIEDLQIRLINET